jgi:hypothetical protein
VVSFPFGSWCTTDTSVIRAVNAEARPMEPTDSGRPADSGRAANSGHTNPSAPLLDGAVQQRPVSLIVVFLMLGVSGESSFRFFFLFWPTAASRKLGVEGRSAAGQLLSKLRLLSATESVAVAFSFARRSRLL